MAEGQPAKQARSTLYAAIVVATLLVISVAVAATRSHVVIPAKEQVSKPVASGPRDAPTRTVDATGGPDAPSSVPGVVPQPVPNAGSGAKSVAPVEPVKQGDALKELKAPPERTIGMIVVPKGFKGAQYSVTFTPYGWGPAGSDGSRLVARISQSMPIDAGAKSLDRDFENRNATLWCSEALADRITVGGSYTGTMLVKPSGETGMLVLTEIASD